MSPVIAIENCRIFHDGTVTEPRLLHPEGVAIDSEGSVWCGGELGQIYRISANGETIEVKTSTGGFTLGIAFDEKGNLYTCDLKYKSIFRYNTRNGDLSEFASLASERESGPPNWPVVDTRRNVLYVSESTGPDSPGPGIWKFDLDTGSGGLWYSRPLAFANGMALSADGNALFVAETFAHRVIRIPILADGAPGEPDIVAELGNSLPDGLALDAEGTLYVACYEPSQILRIQQGREPEVFLHDPTAHTLCHPTNCAFRGAELFISNLGRWHISVVTTQVSGLELPVPVE